MTRVQVHSEWAREGLNFEAEVVVIVDCLSFSTSVIIACERGADVYPFPLTKQSAGFADFLSIYCAGKKSQPGFTLSPSSLLEIDHD